MRYAFNAAPVWVDDVVGFALVAIVMLAAAQALRRGEHIGVDLLVELPRRRKRRRWAQAWAALAASALAARADRQRLGDGDARASSACVTEGSLEWPTWWLMLLMPVGGLLMLLAAIEALWRAGRSVRSRPMRATRSTRRGAARDDRADLRRPAAAAVHRRCRSSPGWPCSAARCCSITQGELGIGDRSDLRRAQPLPAGGDSAVRVHGARDDPRPHRRRPVQHRLHADAPPARRAGHRHHRRLHDLRRDLGLERRDGADHRRGGDPADAALRLRPAHAPTGWWPRAARWAS